LSILLIAIIVFLSSLLTYLIASKFNTHIKGEQSNDKVLLSYLSNLVLVFTNTYYKSSLCCLEHQSIYPIDTLTRVEQRGETNNADDKVMEVLGGGADEVVVDLGGATEGGELKCAAERQRWHDG
jgi:hypothetical protein